MILSPRVLSSAAAIALTCAVSAAAYYYKSRNKEINEVMVFCKLQFNAYNCFDKLISHVEAAKKSVHVCMPSIHNPAIQARLVKLLKETNIKIRIIIDRNGYNESTEFFIKELIDNGAEMKCRVNKPYNMHHKFCIVDDHILLTGTLNWGDDRSTDNWNYVYITSKAHLVEPVKKEFYHMWSIDMDLKEAMKLEPVSYESEEDTAEAQQEEITVKNEVEGEDISTIRKTRVTPELCII